MATNVEKFSISLSAETLAQLEYLREHFLHSPASVPRSQLIAQVIGLAYYDHSGKFPK